MKEKRRKVKTWNGKPVRDTPEKLILTDIPELQRRGPHGILIQDSIEIDLPGMQVIEAVTPPPKKIKPEIVGVPTVNVTVGNRAVNSADHVMGWINQPERDETGQVIVRGVQPKPGATTSAVRQIGPKEQRDFKRVKAFIESLEPKGEDK